MRDYSWAIKGRWGHCSGSRTVSSETKSGNNQCQFMFRDCLLHSGRFQCNWFQPWHQPISQKRKLRGRASSHCSMKHSWSAWMLDSKVQAPGHSPLASLKPSGLVTNGIAQRTPPPSRWLHLIFVLNKPLSQILLAKFPQQPWLIAPKQRSFRSNMFFLCLYLFKINRICFISDFLGVLTSRSLF